MGISEAETRKEMQIAIDMGMENPDPNAMRVFILTGIKLIPGKPSNQKAPTRLCWLVRYYSIHFVIFHTLRKQNPTKFSCVIYTVVSLP